MVQILDRNIQPLSCQLIYLNYILFLTSIWKPNISPFWFGNHLPKNVTFWSMISNVFLSLTMLKGVYDSAYLDAARDKRIFYAGLLGGGAVCLLIAGFTAWWGGKAELDENAVKNVSLFWMSVVLIADALVVSAVVEVEERVKERTRQTAVLIDEKTGKSYTF